MPKIESEKLPIWTEGSRYIKGEEARKINIEAFKAFAEALKTSLGPNGLDKILMKIHGPRPQDVDTAISNYGAKIIKAAQVEHPIAKFITKVVEAQEEEVGDGTKSVIIIAGELLRKAEELLKMGIHPTVIIKGYKKALEEVFEILKEITISVDINKDNDVLKRVAISTMNNKTVEGSEQTLADMTIKAVKQVAEKVNGEKWRVNLDNIGLTRREGGGVSDTKIINGLIIDKEVSYKQMPKRIKNCKILLINKKMDALFFRHSEARYTKLVITKLGQREDFANEQRDIIEEIVEKFAETGANVIFCQQQIDNVFYQPLFKRGIAAIEQTLLDDMERLVKATGARVIQDIFDLKPEDLGKAELFERRKVGNEEVIFIEGVEDPKAIGILVRGGIDIVAREVSRIIKNGLNAVKNVIENPFVVVGGGAVELELSKRLRSHAYKFDKREQLAVKKFAESLECIPEALAKNAGFDAQELLANLKMEHKNGKANIGFDCLRGTIGDVGGENGIFEPLGVKKQILLGAFEAATTVLRIDRIFVERQGPGGPLYFGDKKRGQKEMEEKLPDLQQFIERKQENMNI